MTREPPPGRFEQPGARMAVCFLSNIRSKDGARRRTWAKTWQRIRDPSDRGRRMKPLRFGAHGAGRLDGDHFRPTRGKPSRIATGPRADIQNQRRCVWKQVDQPAVDALGRYGFVATRHIGNILVVPANGVGHHPPDYSHPRSLKAERSTPGGAYHPPAPYRAPSFIATSLLP